MEKAVTNTRKKVCLASSHLLHIILNFKTKKKKGPEIMKRIHFYIYLLIGFIAASFSSCAPDPIDINLPQHQPKLVIFSQVIPEHYMIVGVSKSFSSLAGEADSLSRDSTQLAGTIVEHALVTIRFGDKVETLEHVGGGMYASTSIHQHYGQTYILYVKDSVSGLSCTATSQMLPLVDFDSIKPVVERKPEDTVITMNYSFTDVPGIDNFYMINLHVPTKDSTLSYASLLNIKRKEPTMILLSDKMMKNGRYSVTLKLDVSAKDTVAFTLSNISQEYFMFLSAYQKSGKIFNQITGEPINYPTNIVGGYGFFNTHNPAIKVFNLNDY
jgi:hypothetical protein